MSIQPNELRIGNRVGLKGQSPYYTVSMIESSGSLYFEEVPEFHYDVEDDPVEAIPLSKEVLSSLGFKYKGEYLGEPWYTLNEISITRYGNCYRLCEEDSFEGNLYMIGKPFVAMHQLQNLYFALTGGDLVIL